MAEPRFPIYDSPLKSKLEQREAAVERNQHFLAPEIIASFLKVTHVNHTWPNVGTFSKLNLSRKQININDA